LCGLAAAFGGWALHIGWHHSILDLHEWRQSQTAISAYEMARGGPFWRYLTPILGPTWSLPYELPVYQRIVASIAVSLSLPVELAGRGVSIFFFVATLTSSWFALDILDVRPRYRSLFVALALVSPLYLFWSRTFMIESTALFFAVTYLLAVHRATKEEATARQAITWLIVALAAGLLGGMTKVTTFVPWWTGAAILVWSRIRRGRLSRATLAAVATVLIVCPIAAAGWLAFTDVVKAENPLSEHLEWATGAWQNFGPLAMRLEPRSWYMVPGSTILGSTRHTVIGSLVVFAAAWLAIAGLRRRLTPALVCFALYVLPIAIFMHLYTAHVYYSYANGLLLITIVGCGIVALLERRDAISWLGLALFTGALLAGSTNYLGGYYVDQQSDDVSHWPLATLLQRRLPAGDVLLIYGLDLDPEFPYMARRRAIMSWVNRGAGDPAFERSLALLAQEGGQIGALVACGDSRRIAVIQLTKQRLALADRPAYGDSYCDVYVPPDRTPARAITFR